MAKFGVWVFVLSLALLAGCATKPYVATDYEEGYNFSALKTFSIKETETESKENILISPFTLSHIHTVLNDELSKRYQSSSKDATPDFFVSYHIVMEEKLEPRNFDELYGFGMWGGGYRYPSSIFYRPSFGDGVRVYNQGSLIVDMVDAKTQQPIWRGVSEKRLNKRLSAEEQRKILTSAVLQILAKFPPVK